MKLHIITIGQPKLAYAKQGWEEYLKRLKLFHDVRITHIADKHNEAAHILAAASGSYKIALEIAGKQLTSPQLADFLEKRAQAGQEVCFIIGGPDGLPDEVTDKSDYQWSLSQLTFPHDLAMVVLMETLYRASSIASGLPYHK